MNVLLVDDDRTDRYVAKRYLKRDDRIGAIVEAEDGDEAYELLESGRFESDLGPHPPASLVLLDINMPRMSGFELLEKLKREGVAVKLEDNVVIVVLLTSSTYYRDRARAAELKNLVKDYIEKPLTSEKLDELINTYWAQNATW